ncbi:MAG: 16S rRNA (guanine(966)-N(2))-methyltransferase RsmD [Parvibaculales bacterium]
MRILGGAYKGKPLTVPKNTTTRPTAAKMREAIFDIILNAKAINLEPLSILDGFAGAGAMGLEALSRGAKTCLFIENNPRAIKAIQKNQQALGMTKNSQILRKDITHLGKFSPQKPNATPYDIIFLDPPYNKSLGEKAITALEQGNWLSPQALIFLEESPQTKITLPPNTTLTLQDQRPYSNTQLLLFQ